jgi:hypothetical protein
VGNIKIDFREIGWDGVDWTDPAQDRDEWRALVNTVMNYILSFVFPSNTTIYQLTHISLCIIQFIGRTTSELSYA